MKHGTMPENIWRAEQCETRSRDDVLAAVEELAKLHLVLPEGGEMKI